jgi:hypothetical protein
MDSRLEREGGRDETEEHDAHRIEIGARVHRMTQHLFGRHVGRRAEHLADVGQVDRTLEPRDPEVHDLDRPAVRDHQVAWLQIAVHHACGVRVGECGERLHAELSGTAGREHADLVEDLLKRLTADQLPSPSRAGRRLPPARRPSRFQGWVSRASAGGFARRTGGRVCDGGVENLEGDIARERLVDSSVDGCPCRRFRDVRLRGIDRSSALAIAICATALSAGVAGRCTQRETIDGTRG